MKAWSIDVIFSGQFSSIHKIVGGIAGRFWFRRLHFGLGRTTRGKKVKSKQIGEFRWYFTLEA